MAIQEKEITIPLPVIQEGFHVLLLASEGDALLEDYAASVEAVFSALIRYGWVIAPSAAYIPDSKKLDSSSCS